ncbi:hypothetical protein RJT34_11022 [Clitoria ternatea]|uniref:Uncharacterized protein n=1 Tax=Clitoria ternatea TaxID=43366 RepID=A0AAN9PI26_CLITE
MHTLKESVQEISRQTKDALESKGLALDHESSTLRWLLDTIKNTDYEEAEPEDSFDHKDVAVKDEVDAAMDVGEASTSRHIWEEAAEGNDGHQQQEIFIDGMVDGLLEAKSSIRSLDFGKTLSAALDKMSQHWVTLTGSDPEVEMKVYKEGIMCGLREASLSFPNLDIETTLNAVVNTETQSHDEAGMDLREYEGRDSDEEQGSDQEMRRVLWGGMADGLLEAIKTFPALDIQTTIRTALNKTTWLPPNPRVEVNIYIKGIVKGLREAKLTFPTLDILATLNIVLSRETQNRPPDTEPPPMVNEVLGQHQNLSDTDEDDEAKTFEISDSESLALTSTDSETLTDIGEDCTDVAKYDKLTIFLEGRVEELQRLYDAEMESFHNSKKFEHLSKAIYWKGLIDGLLDAPSILHAMDHERITEQVLKENEASVKEEHVEAADHNENLDGTTGETVSSPDRKRQKRDTVADILGYKRERDDTGDLVGQNELFYVLRCTESEPKSSYKLELVHKDKVQFTNKNSNVKIRSAKASVKFDCDHQPPLSHLFRNLSGSAKTASILSFLQLPSTIHEYVQ